MEKDPLLADIPPYQAPPYTTTDASAVAQVHVSASPNTTLLFPVLSCINLGLAIWTMITSGNSSDAKYILFSIICVTFASFGFIIAPLQISSSYVARFRNRPYLLFTAAVAIIFATFGIAAMVMSWIWVGFGNFRFSYMPTVVVMAICLTLNVVFLWFWAIQAIRYHKLNPLSTVTVDPNQTPYLFPAASFRILACIYGVLCLPLLFVTPFSINLMTYIHTGFVVATALLLVLASFLAPRRWLILLSSIWMVLLLPFSLTAFTFSVTLGYAAHPDTTSFNSSGAVLQAFQSVVGFIWMTYGFHFFHMSKNGFLTVLQPHTQIPFPRRRLIAFSSVTLIFSIGCITATAFSCVVASIVYMSLGFALSILMIVASAVTPSIGLIFVSGMLSCVYIAWGLSSMFSSLFAGLFSVSCSGGGISLAVLTSIQLGFVGAWALLALDWFHHNNPERLPEFPSVILRSISVFLLVNMSVTLILSCVNGYLFGIIFTSLTTLLMINMTIASFLPPNRTYVLICAVFGIASLIGCAADFGIAVRAVTWINTPQSVVFITAIVLSVFSSSIFFFLLLTWIIFAFLWFHKTQNAGGLVVIGGSAVSSSSPYVQQIDETAALKETVTRLTSQVELLTNRLGQAEYQQQPHHQQQQQPYYATPQPISGQTPSY